MKASVKHIRLSPRKANIVAGLMRNKKADETLVMLKYLDKKAAKIFYKILHSAISNAENNFAQKSEDLLIDQVLVSKGVTYKRGQSHSRGRITPILKRTSNLTVKLTTVN
jgi:large subunit ribosomal protein L22